MSQHQAFVMNASVQLSSTAHFVVMCSQCGHKRPRMIADCGGTGKALNEAYKLRDAHNASNIVTDVMGKAV